MHALSGGKDRTVRLWNLNEKENKLVYIFLDESQPAHKKEVTALAFSPDCKSSDSGGASPRSCTIASGDASGLLKVWEWNRTKPSAVKKPLPLFFRGHRGSVDSLVFASRRQGQRLFSGSKDGRVRLWEFDSVKVTKWKTLTPPDDNTQAKKLPPVEALAVSGGGARVVSLRESNGQNPAELKVWQADLEGEKAISDLRKAESSDLDKAIEVLGHPVLRLLLKKGCIRTDTNHCWFGDPKNNREIYAQLSFSNFKQRDDDWQIKLKLPKPVNKLTVDKALEDKRVGARVRFKVGEEVKLQTADINWQGPDGKWIWIKGKPGKYEDSSDASDGQTPDNQPTKYPKWWDKWTSNPKKGVYYGYGFAETRENAANEARREVIAELGITLKLSTECITQGASSSNQGGNRESSNKCKSTFTALSQKTLEGAVVKKRASVKCKSKFTAESQETPKGAVVKKRATNKCLEFAVIRYKKPKSKR